MSGFVPFLLILLILSLLLRLDFFLTIFYLFAAVYLLSRFWLGRMKAGLGAELRFTPRVFTGNTVRLELTVRNTSWLPIPWVALVESLPAELALPWQPDLLHLEPSSHRTLSYEFPARKRGYYAIGPLQATTGDVLGIVPRHRVQLAPVFLTVYPHIVPLQHLGLPTRSPLAVLPSTWPLFEDTSRVTGVRNYEDGDSPRNIHWTASASAGQLLVKRYQPAVARETLIVLDMDSDHYVQRTGATELAIVAAASLAYHILVREKLPVGLATEARDLMPNRTEAFHLPPRPERAHLMHILEVLARLMPITDSSLIDLIRRERLRLAYGTTLVVITGRESAELYDTLLSMRRAGFAIALILIHAPLSAKPINQPRGISVYRIAQEKNLETDL